MLEPATPSAATALTEEEFAARVEAWSANPDRHAALTALLCEADACYSQRGAGAVVRMRGWVFIGLARLGIDDADLPFVLEELESGIDPYLVAAAARALRSRREPLAELVPFVLKAFANLRSSDEPLSFEAYGEYATGRANTTALGELVLTLEWLRPVSRDSLDAIEEITNLCAPQKYRRPLTRIIKAIRRSSHVEKPRDACCRFPGGWGSLLAWTRGARRDSRDLDRIAFEDHSGAVVTFAELFRGRPTIVAFFYTRCDNPMKCSLTITKLARIQKLLSDRGLAGLVQIVAITYDPDFDIPQRMARYGRDRGLCLDDGALLVRTPCGFDVIRRHFSLGINFIESIVNRHRLELFVLDREGNTAFQFARLQWGEQQVVDRAFDLLDEEPIPEASSINSSEPANGVLVRGSMSGMLGMGASIGAAFFPKCPICWAAFFSVFGIAGFGQIPYSPWLLPLLVIMMLVNLASVGWRGFETKRMGPFYLAAAGAVAIIGGRLGLDWAPTALIGVLLTLAGSFWAVFDSIRERLSRTA